MFHTGGFSIFQHRAVGILAAHCPVSPANETMRVSVVTIGLDLYKINILPLLLTSLLRISLSISMLQVRNSGQKNWVGAQVPATAA